MLASATGYDDGWMDVVFFFFSLLVGRSIRHCNVEQAINYNWGRYAAQGAG
jgi:hypothetical protein